MRRPTSHRRKKAAPARRKTSRRRRVSGFKSSIITDALIVGVGSIIAREGSNLILKQFPGVSQTMIGFGQIAAGVGVASFLKNKYADKAGLGIAAYGMAVTAVNLGLISGIHNGKKYISGTPYLSVVNGTSKLSPVNGVNNDVMPPSQNRYVKNFSYVV